MAEPTYGAAKALLKRGLSEQQVANQLGLRVEVVATWFRDETGIRGYRGGGKPAWLKRPMGDRFPYPPGRSCDDCGTVLNRYNPGPYCLVCQPTYDEMVEAIA